LLSFRENFLGKVKQKAAFELSQFAVHVDGIPFNDLLLELISWESFK
jgi:hypothetical protein